MYTCNAQRAPCGMRCAPRTLFIVQIMCVYRVRAQCRAAPPLLLSPSLPLSPSLFASLSLSSLPFPVFPPPVFPSSGKAERGKGEKPERRKGRGGRAGKRTWAAARPSGVLCLHSTPPCPFTKCRTPQWGSTERRSCSRRQRALAQSATARPCALSQSGSSSQGATVRPRALLAKTAFLTHRKGGGRRLACTRGGAGGVLRGLILGPACGATERPAALAPPKGGLSRASHCGRQKNRFMDVASCRFRQAPARPT